MIVCDKCKKQKELTKYIIPKEDWVGWDIKYRSQVLKEYTEYKVIPVEMELCDECATEVARKIWN